MKKVALISAIVLLVAAGGATAQSLITSGDIKNGTIKKKDLSKKTVSKLKGQTGPAGPAGPQGPQGEPGPAGGTGGGSTLRVLLQTSGDAPITDLLSINGHKIQGGCQGGNPVLRSQTTVDNSTVKGLGDGAGNKFYTESDNFDVGTTVIHTNANTQDSAVFNLTYVSLAGEVVTSILGVESAAPNFDCLIFGTATVAP